MSELLLCPFQGDSSDQVNGVPLGAKVFIYDLKFEPYINTTRLQPYLEEIGWANQDSLLSVNMVNANFLYVKREMGMIDVENSILQTIEFKYSTKKIDRERQMDDFLTKKFHEIYKVHNKMCHFIL